MIEGKMGEHIFTIKIEAVSRPSVLSDDLVQSERRRFTISEDNANSIDFSQSKSIRRTVDTQAFTRQVTKV
jgi:hypothetical protein